MKKYKLAAILAAAGLLIFLVLQDAGGTDRSDPEAGTMLPKSLDNFYPPAAPGPVLLFAMHEMSTPFSGTLSDLSEGDFANANANYENFRAQYLKVSRMVPEWEHYYPMAPVDAFGEALKSGDQGQIMAAADALGKSCNECHYRYMVPVQHKYHWGDFSMLTVADPVTGADFPFTVFKHMMESDFDGIGLDLQQGQLENARARLNGFQQRFQALKETCSACHDSDPKYYVGENVAGMIAGLKANLDGNAADPKAVGELLQGIGQESCFKCHLVHTPAAYAKYQTPH